MLWWDDIRREIEKVKTPNPVFGGFGRNALGSDFIFLTKLPDLQKNSP